MDGIEDNNEEKIIFSVKKSELISIPVLRLKDLINQRMITNSPLKQNISKGEEINFDDINKIQFNYEVIVFKVPTKTDLFFKVIENQIDRGELQDEIIQDLKGDKSLIVRRRLSRLVENGDTLSVFESVYITGNGEPEFEFINDREKMPPVIVFEANQETPDRAEIIVHIFYKHWLPLLEKVKELVKYHWPEFQAIIFPSEEKEPIKPALPIPIEKELSEIDQLCIKWVERGYLPGNDMVSFLEKETNNTGSQLSLLSIDQFKKALKSAGERGILIKVGRRWRPA